jgi:hypothetical protein
MHAPVLELLPLEPARRARCRPLRRLIFTLGIGALLASGGVHAQQCEVVDSRGDSRDVMCMLNASESVRFYRFRADFSGSHDDTRVWIVAALDGAPVRCATGSKTLSEAEDGDVTLACRFQPDAKADTKQILSVRIAWRHAQPGEFGLDLE